MRLFAIKLLEFLPLHQNIHSYYSLYFQFGFDFQVQLSNIKRCVLISYNPVTQLLDFRHYTVTVSPVGLSRGIKKVVIGKVPNLGKCEDIADFLTS